MASSSISGEKESKTYEHDTTQPNPCNQVVELWEKLSDDQRDSIISYLLLGTPLGAQLRPFIPSSYMRKNFRPWP